VIHPEVGQMAVKVIELGFGINLAVNHKRRSLVIFFSEQVFAFSRAFKVRSKVVTAVPADMF
jgi:hypothetical protein